MSSTLDSRWATDTDRKRADKGQNVSRYTVALQVSRDLHPESDSQQPEYSQNNTTTSPTYYKSTGWRRTNYQCEKRNNASSPSIARPWNAVAFKNKKPIEHKDSSPPQVEKWQSTPITQSVSSNSIPEQQHPSSEKESNPVSNHGQDDDRNYPRQTKPSSPDEQTLNLGIESLRIDNTTHTKQKALEAEETRAIESQSESNEPTVLDIQQEIRREREANAARKLRAAQMREWDCDKTMEGWT